MSESIDELIEKLLKGEISISKLDQILDANLAALARRLFLEKKFNVKLTAIASTLLDFKDIVSHNIENPIGAVQIPLGVVGPLKIDGDFAKGEYYVPMATTEGALVAGVNRGVKLLTLSGGAKAKVIYDGMARAPLIWTPSVNDAVNLSDWLKNHINEIKESVKHVTKHGELKELQIFIVGNMVWPRFVFSTGDAMGMNMATIASDNICKYIENNYKGDYRCISVSGNLCVDKKPNYLNKILGRGKYVIAEAVIKEEVLKKVMRTTSYDIDYINKSKNLLGNAVAGSLSYNAHVANIVAAIFAATGQDIAQVVESSMSYVWTETRGQDLYISTTLTSLEVGTVGGGTWLPTQKEALDLLGVSGGGNPSGINSLKLAEIIASMALAGELNLLAAQATGELASAHEKLGRGGKK
ncbi:MAG: hydroxymethylglutaryl-CoA reductase (NADPH) [Caldisphaera sp.]|jgi:hydroxymethylglutaryl-CoA reductase (NADPH)|nr:hydroxymethylglutaryl-CoA reductase (NADPH) [Caldisphaera sp.]PMP60593.1 MAG: hydroxymethylglutaryl-CoA reductase (NADPH) [Caldisphaera sp.]PMP89787.1 MAG: hydroxymethylglutaryl-CoA reductase (NADPH) [Caldisphaera sp.]